MSTAPEPAPQSQPPGVKLFVPPGHFYSPIVDPKEAEPHIAALEAAPMPAVLPGIAIDHATTCSGRSNIPGSGPSTTTGPGTSSTPMFNDYMGKLEGPFLRNPGGGLWLRRR